MSPRSGPELRSGDLLARDLWPGVEAARKLGAAPELARAGAARSQADRHDGYGSDKSEEEQEPDGALHATHRTPGLTRGEQPLALGTVTTTNVLLLL